MRFVIVSANSYIQCYSLNKFEIVLALNHPSESLKPSHRYEALTTKIKCAGNVLDIKVVGHLIISDESYFSFCK